MRGDDRDVVPGNIIEKGVNHAFASPYGRFRFVAWTASRDGAITEGPTVPPPSNFADLKLAGTQWEWFQLVGLQELQDMTGIERAPEHRLGEMDMRREVEFREFVRATPWAMDRLLDLLVTDEIKSMNNDINMVCFRANRDPHRLFLEDLGESSPPEAMRAFVNALPPANTRTSCGRRVPVALGYQRHAAARL